MTDISEFYKRWGSEWKMWLTNWETDDLSPDVHIFVNHDGKKKGGIPGTMLHFFMTDNDHVRTLLAH